MGGECAMTTDALTCANFTTTRRPAARDEHALRYDNLTRVLLGLEERVSVPIPPKHERKTSKDQFRIAELRESVAVLKAENERAIDRIADDLNGLADRIAELEARAQRPFWRRALGSRNDRAEPYARARGKLADRLRSLFLYGADAKRPSAA
jgi:hypothetical protein